MAGLEGSPPATNIDRLVYFERFTDICSAIDREKQIKGMKRIRKITLIVSINPEWKDLSTKWFENRSFATLRMTLEGG
jgi:predicted GIY-YIG superfamily endonuclease